MSDRNDNKPNVLLVICDDLNNAILGMGRTPCAPVPHVQRLVRSGVRFTNAHNNCSLCLPSRNSMLSGLYAHTTGHFTLWDEWRTTIQIKTTAGGNSYTGRALLDEAVMLPKHFKDNGYETFGVGKVPHEGETDTSWWAEYAYGPDYGPIFWDPTHNRHAAYPERLWMYEGEPLQSYINRYEGLDRHCLNGKELRHIEFTFGPLSEVFCRSGVDVRNGDLSPYRYVDYEDRDRLPDEKAARWAVEVLQREHENQFFLAVGFMKPHTPLNAPNRFFKMVPGRRTGIAASPGR